MREELTVVTCTKTSAEELMEIIRARHKSFSEQPHCEIRIPCGLKYGGTPEYELAYLAHVAYSCGTAFAADNVIVEIGSLVGKSTIAMASVASNKIIAIDPHDGPWEILITDSSGACLDNREKMGNTLLQFMGNLKYFGVEDKVYIIQQYSDEAAREWAGEKICLLFIDGDHSEKWVRHDFEAFYPHMAPGGLIAFHDYSKSFNGVKTVVDEAIEKGLIRKERLVGSLFMAQALNNC